MITILKVSSEIALTIPNLESFTLEGELTPTEHQFLLRIVGSIKTLKAAIALRESRPPVASPS